MLRKLEDHGKLGNNKKFFGGDRIGMTDLVLGWICGWLEPMEEAVGEKILEPNTFPFLEDWIQNFRDVPQIKDTLPNGQKFLAYFMGLRERFVLQAS